MSATIDQRVVEMQFDNRHFERNVQTSLSTLEKLKQGLNLNGAAKGLESINDAANKCTMPGLSSAIDVVQTKFSALQVMGVTALANITNSAVNAGKRIANALTIEPIKTGLQEYETQINAVQTILANTQSKGTTLNDVNAALDELNKYADQTIYNFTEMTRNIGTFTAAGVDLDKSVTSIKGIANLAAVSGSTSQQASTAMYQLSQALAAGKVQLMDWNSVVNAGMGGEVFQNALKRTAKNLGTNVDAMIEKYGSFRESLTKGEWLTAEVLTETLTQLSGAYTEADLLAQGYTREQAKEIVELAKTAVSAATDVKTFTQLVDTTKEALQSGWTQTWEILIGDFEEAKSLWSGVSRILSEFINASASARNALLEGWAKGGGREMAIETVKNAFEGLMSVLTPIKEAFREVFPPATAEQLLNISERIKKFSEGLKLSDEQSAKLKSTFKGMFSIIKMGVDVITTIGGGFIKLLGAVSGIGNGIISVTGAFGKWISNVTSSMNVTDALSKCFEFVANSIEKFVSFVGKNFAAPGFDGFLGIMDRLWNTLSKIGNKVVDVGSKISGALVDVFRSGDILAALDIVNGGLFAGILLAIKKYITNMAGPFDEVGGLFDNIKNIFDGVKGSLESFQRDLQAQTLLKIAGAVAVLAASITVIAMIDPNKLNAALGAITILFADLIGAMAAFNAIGGVYPKTIKSIGLMVGISTSVLILASALKKVADLSLGELAKGLVGVAGLTAIVVGMAKAMSTNGGVIMKGAGQMILIAGALKILASVCKDLSKFSWSELGKGLAGVTALTVALAGFMRLTSGSKFGLSTGASLILLATSMNLLASAVGEFAKMKWEGIAKGLLAMAGALTAITLAVNLMPKNMMSTGAGLLIISGALMVLSNTLSKMGGMTWDEIGKGLAALGGSMLVLALGLKAMTGSLAGSAALIVAASALAIFAPVLKTLGSMSWGEIGKGLIAIAGAFTILGVAALVLTPVVPTILALSGAIALLGASCLAIGAGLALIATGIASLAVSAAAGATSIVAALTTIILGIAGLIPAVAARLGEGIVIFCQVIGESAEAIGGAIKSVVLTLIDVLVECIPQLVDGALTLISEVLTSLATHAPQIIESLGNFLLALINGLADYLPEFIQAGVNIFAQFFQGIIDALRGLDVSTIVNAIAGVGFLAALFMALGAISALIPSAMAGVLGMGILIAELAIVLAAVGAIAQIPGLSWFISEGGAFLQLLGNAIGQFVGGIAGGFVEGISSSFPQLANDLSAFMNNLQPFIQGAKSIDAALVDGVKTLASTILILTAADILEGITSWLTGGSSISDFGEELVPFGKAIKAYANEVAGIDVGAITGSVTAAKALVKLADIIPNSGGLASIFAGDNELSSFGTEMISFGKSLKKYSEAVVGVNPTLVASSVQSAKMLVQFIKGIGSIDTSSVASLKTALDTLGKVSVDKFINAFKASIPNLTSIGTDMTNAVIIGIQRGRAFIVANITTVVADIVKVFETTKASFANIGEQLMSNVQIGLNKGSLKTISVAKSNMTRLLKTMINTLREKYRGFYDAGVYLVKGFTNGIADNVNKAAAKAEAMATAALRAVQKKLDIHSPSRETQEYGKYFAIGFVKGIEQRMKEVHDISFKVGQTATEGLTEGLKGTDEAVYVTGEEMLNIMVAAYENAINARKNYWSELMALRKKEQADRAAEEAEVESYADKLNSSYEALMEKNSLFSAVSANSSTAASSTANKKDISKTEELTKNLQDQIRHLRRYEIVMKSLKTKLAGTGLGEAISKMGIESIIELEVINSMTEKQLDEYVRLYDAKGEAARNAAVTQIEGLGHDLAESQNYELQQFQKEILAETTDILAGYTSELDRNTDSLLNRSNIFNEVNEKEKVTSKQLMDNLEDQVDQMAEYFGTMTALEMRLGDTSLWSTIKEMGVESLAELQALNQMSGTELDKYVSLFESKYTLAKKAAALQLDELKVETESKLSKLWGGANVELDEFLVGFDGTFESINEYVMKAQAIGDGMAAAMALGVSNGADKVKAETLTTVHDSVNSGEKTAKREADDIGYYLAKGFADGIRNNTYLAEQAAREMAKAAAAAAKKAAKINSPSKVTYELGGFFGMGFVNGISEYIDKASTVGRNMAVAAKDGLSNAISRIADGVNSSMDIQPTIRPVVDLSNVESSAALLDSMFARDQAMAISTNMKRQAIPVIQNGAETPKAGNTYEFKQYNYSPKALSRAEIYRQTKNQFSALKGLVET